MGESTNKFAMKAMLRHYMEQWRKLQKPMWIPIESCCGSCEGGGTVSNLLWDVTAVEQDVEFDRYSVDLVLWRKGQSPIAIYVSDDLRPSLTMIRYFMDSGIDLHEFSIGRNIDTRRLEASHIAPANCLSKQRGRTSTLWEHLAALPRDECRIGIRRDFRSEKRKAEEFKQLEEHWRDITVGMEKGNYVCFQCSATIRPQEDGLRLSQTWVHWVDGGDCGYVPLCERCSMLGVGMATPLSQVNGSAEPGLSDSCPRCMEKQGKLSTVPPASEPVVMDEGRFLRWVHPPTMRNIQYVVGKKSVNPYDFQVIAASFCTAAMLTGQRSTAEHMKEILDNVQYPNNITDWDWRTAIGESYVSIAMAPPQGDTGDRWWYPKVAGWRPDVQG